MSFLTTTDNLLIKSLIHIAFGLVSGTFISLSYSFCDRNRNYSKNFFLTVLVLPSLVGVTIPMIGTDIAKAISLGGVFTLVRFRSMPGDSRDILYIFFTMAAGLAIGVEQYAVAVTASILISVFLVAVMRCLCSGTGDSAQVLKITVPENVNYKEVFSDIFAVYLSSWNITNVKMTNMGTLFTVTYNVRFLKNADEKQFLDDIRVRNGNLNIILGQGDELCNDRL